MSERGISFSPRLCLASVVPRRERHSLAHSGETHVALKEGQIVRRQRVGLGNDGDQVDPRPEALHDLDIERFQRVTRRPDKVQARVDAHVVLLPALGLLLLTHVGFVLVVLWIRRCAGPAVGSFSVMERMTRVREQRTIKSTIGFHESRLLT